MTADVIASIDGAYDDPHLDGAMGWSARLGEARGKHLEGDEGDGLSLPWTGQKEREVTR